MLSSVNQDWEGVTECTSCTGGFCLFLWKGFQHTSHCENDMQWHIPMKTLTVGGIK